MNDELEPEVLSYREFKNRETLLAWEQRRRACEAQSGRSDTARRVEADFLKPSSASRRAASPSR